MEKREDVLREALEQNEKEVQRWESYIKENETAISNMNMFSKMLTVDVMVPFGKKAFFPGHLIHTNEILVAHSQDYFSKCSAHTATEICKRRIENGKKRLEEFETERDLFQNKLEKPYFDGVLPNSEEKEIIEEYDEEKERIWREKHRKSVKEAKLKEKQERENQKSSDNDGNKDPIQTLEEDEKLIEELNEELAELEIEYKNETEDMLKKLMSGEINLPPPKKRLAHATKKTPTTDGEIKLEPIKSKKEHQPVKIAIEDIINSSEVNNDKSEISDDGNESDSSGSETPEEIRLIENQAEYLPQNDRAGFYQYQLYIIDQKISKRSFSNNKELEEKLHLFKIRDHLEELIEELPGSDSELQVIDENEKEDVIEKKHENNPPKRRISFALEDQMLEFRKNESVARMLPASSPKEETPPPQRDIIRLDEPVLKEDNPGVDSENEVKQEAVVRQKTILEKVEENMKTQNLEDADLVKKIIDSRVGRVKTLTINFKHSEAQPHSSDDEKTEITSSPADFYKLIQSTESNKEDADTDESRNFYLKESDRDRAYVDVRSQFMVPSIDKSIKSILKNTSAHNNSEETEAEPNIVQQKKPKMPKKPKVEEEYLSAYNKVMGDVIENKTEPDPLPEGKFENMHAPKRRISRFKQLQSEKHYYI